MRSGWGGKKEAGTNVAENQAVGSMQGQRISFFFFQLIPLFKYLDLQLVLNGFRAVFQKTSEIRLPGTQEPIDFLDILFYSWENYNI